MSVFVEENSIKMESAATDKEKSVSLHSNSFAKMLYNSHRRSFFVAQAALRAIATAASVVAISLTLTSKVSVMLYGIRFVAKYSYTSAYRFLLGVNSVVCGVSLLSLLALYFLSRSKSNVKNYFLLLLHDLVMTIFSMSGCAAATAVGYIGRYGEQKVGWFPVCDQVPSFCNRQLIAVILSYVAFFCYFALTFSSTSRLVHVSSSRESS